MARCKILIISFLLFGFFPTYAQDFIEGRIVYDITFPELDMDEATRGSLPRESVVFVKGDLTRTDLNVGPRMSSTSIYNYKSGEVTALTEFMDSKTYIVMTPGKGPVPTQNSNQLTVFDTERKTIAGFDCKRAVMKNKDNVSSNLYYTDLIKARLAVNVQFPGVDGFPMEFMVDQNGLKMMFSVRQVIAESVPDSVFSIPSDYKQVTPDDLMQIYKSVEDSNGGGEVKDFELPKNPK
ncbi:MAG: DUF4412 domain-containing protein [Bacteroidota bacterium]